MILTTCRSAAAGGRAQETDKDLGGKIEEGLGPHGLGIITIADVSSKRCGLTACVNRDFESCGLSPFLNRSCIVTVLMLSTQVPEFPELRKRLLRLAPRHVVYADDMLYIPLVLPVRGGLFYPAREESELSVY